MELKLKGDIKETNYIVVMDTLFQYINTDFEKYDNYKTLKLKYPYFNNG